MGVQGSDIVAELVGDHIDVPVSWLSGDRIGEYAVDVRGHRVAVISARRVQPGNSAVTGVASAAEKGEEIAMHICAVEAPVVAELAERIGIVEDVGLIGLQANVRNPHRRIAIAAENRADRANERADILGGAGGVLKDVEVLPVAVDREFNDAATSRRNGAEARDATVISRTVMRQRATAERHIGRTVARRTHELALARAQARRLARHATQREAPLPFAEIDPTRGARGGEREIARRMRIAVDRAVEVHDAAQCAGELRRRDALARTDLNARIERRGLEAMQAHANFADFVERKQHGRGARVVRTQRGVEAVGKAEARADGGGPRGGECG